MSARRVSSILRSPVAIQLATSITFSFLLAYVLTCWQATWSHSIRPVELEGSWIRSPGEPAFSGYFRKRLDINSPIRHAWMVVAAKDGFELTVNRNPAGRRYLWRPTRPFQNGSSEKGQVLSHQKSALALNFPREYQWDGHDHWKLPTYIEFSKHLNVGKNVLCLEVESRSLPATVSFHGEIHLWNGEIIPISSDESWQSEPVPLGPQIHDWTEPSYRSLEWRHAVKATVPGNNVWRSHPEEIYSLPFQGRWMHSRSQSPGTTFSTSWNLPGPVDEAFVRVMTNRRFVMMINGQRVSVACKRPPDLGNGQWVLGLNSALDPVATPVLLDPDETANFFIGEKFKNPRDAQANLEEFRNLKPKTHLPFRNYKTTNRAEDGGEFDPTRTLSESRSTPEKPDLPVDRPVPNSLKRDRRIRGFLGFNITPLLNVGENHLEIRIVGEDQSNWRPAIAIDGQARLRSGQLCQIPEEAQWNSEDTRQGRSAVDIGYAASNSSVPTPSIQYHGSVLPSTAFGIRLQRNLTPLLLLFPLIGIALLAIEHRLVKRRHQQDFAPPDPNHSLPGWSRTYAVVLLASSCVLGCGILLQVSLQERHEILWFYRGTGWLWILRFAVGIAATVCLVELIRHFRWPRTQTANWNPMGSLRSLPETRAWPHMIVWVLLFCALIRGYKLDLQPLDDDEYASTQAIVAIMETGVPKFVPDGVYYTRSPLFHYVTAAIALPFGANLWSLRFQSVAWSIATAFLTYLCGSRLLQSRWVGFTAMLLIAIHPFEIFTGHVIRFYQMQQFLALLTIYLFCRGFVTQQCQKYRIATVVAFLCAVLAQEISAVLGVPLLLGYMLFAKDLGWKNNIQLMIISAAVILVIAVDLFAFKTLCLTRTEGVSPTAEASIKPHFWYPMNFLSIFIGYSRLHVVPSFFCLLGLPLLWKEKNQNAFALAMFLFAGVICTNLLVSHVSLRYQYWLFPVWILVSLVSIRLVLLHVFDFLYQATSKPRQATFAAGLMFATILASIVISWSPWRIPGTYEMRILGDSTGCVRWVKSQMQEGDKLAITEPHTHAGFLEAGKIDFDIAVPLLYDFAVFQEGRLIDRNGGGELVNSVDQLISTLEKHDRVWILINREKFRTRGKNLRWEYPGARFEMFVRKNCELKHRTYLWHAYLWDSSRGHYCQFNKQK